MIQQILARFPAEKVQDIPLWGGLPLYRLHLPPDVPGK